MPATTRRSDRSIRLQTLFARIGRNNLIGSIKLVENRDSICLYGFRVDAFQVIRAMFNEAALIEGENVSATVEMHEGFVRLHSFKAAR